MSVYPNIEITERGFGQVKKGSLWIFSNEFVTKIKGLYAGGWMNFQCRGEFVGFGYVNPHSLITGRILSRLPVKDRRALFVKLISESAHRRSALYQAGSYRAVFSESDGVPGLIVDVYAISSAAPLESGAPAAVVSRGGVAVAQFTTKGIDEAKDDIAYALKTVFEPKGLVLRGDSSIRHLEGAAPFLEIVMGQEAELRASQVREDDVLFAADFVKGQKTGFFIDQRPNRRHLKALSRGKTVLDLCCYSGGWGLSALKGGASHVTFVDQSKEAIELVQKGLALNGKDFASRATLTTEDVFDFLAKDTNRYDIVIADPPAFVKSKKNLPQAIQAYKKLNMQAIKRLKPGGLLYTCSCSFHISDEEFQNILTECLQKTGFIGEVLYRGGQGEDHPWILNRPESRYLKCLAVRVLAPF